MQKVRSKHKKNKKALTPFYTYLKETERRRKQEYEDYLEFESEYLGISPDVLAGESQIQISGTHSVFFFGTYTMERYKREQIILQTKRKKIIISGEHLKIEYFRKDEIKIVGKIGGLSFCGEGE